MMNARKTNHFPSAGLGALLAACVLGAAGGCERNEMHQQARVDPLEESSFYSDGRASRMPPAGTVSRTGLRLDDAVYTGMVGGEPVDVFPLPVTRRTLDRGQERYDIFCSVCHGHTGDGNGMIVQRGFTRPPSFHIDRLRTAPAGHLYNVISNGYGAMYSYNDRITPEDRWAIVAYIRALQLSQHYPADRLSPEERAQVEQAQQAMLRQQQARGRVEGQPQSQQEPPQGQPSPTTPTPEKSH